MKKSKKGVWKVTPKDVYTNEGIVIIWLMGLLLVALFVMGILRLPEWTVVVWLAIVAFLFYRLMYHGFL